MLIESLVKATVELQGFRVVSVTGGTSGLVATIARDRRYSPRCGRCLEPAPYRDTRRTRGFRHVPMWGITVELRNAPRRVSCPRCDGVHVEAMPWLPAAHRRLAAPLCKALTENLGPMLKASAGTARGPVAGHPPRPGRTKPVPASDCERHTPALDRIRIDRTHIAGSIDPVNPVYIYKVEQIHAVDWDRRRRFQSTAICSRLSSIGHVHGGGRPA